MAAHFPAEMFHQHLGLLSDAVRVQAQESGQRLRGLLLRQVRIILRRFHQPTMDGVGHVVLRHAEDESFLHRLPHRVEMKHLGQSTRALASEEFQRLALGRGSEGEEARVRLLPARLHHLIQTVFPIRFALRVLGVECCAENGLQLPRHLAALAGVRLVHDDRITARGDFRGTLRAKATSQNRKQRSISPNTSAMLSVIGFAPRHLDVRPLGSLRSSG